MTRRLRLPEQANRAPSRVEAGAAAVPCAVRRAYLIKSSYLVSPGTRTISTKESVAYQDPTTAVASIHTRSPMVYMATAPMTAQKPINISRPSRPPADEGSIGSRLKTAPPVISPAIRPAKMYMALLNMSMPAPTKTEAARTVSSRLKQSTEASSERGRKRPSSKSAPEERRQWTAQSADTAAAPRPSSIRPSP
eukprot:scaffold14068_cov119-Isochrysis_galbana.AAC.25